MPRLAIYKSFLESARDRSAMSDEELEHVRALVDKVPPGMQRVELNDFPMPFLRSLLEDAKLKPNQRAVLALHIHGMRDADVGLDDVYRIRAANPIELGSAFGMFRADQPNAELAWNGRWYPVGVRATFREDEHRLARIVSLQVVLALGEQSHELGRRLHRQWLKLQSVCQMGYRDCPSEYRVQWPAQRQADQEPPACR